MLPYKVGEVLLVVKDRGSLMMVLQALTTQDKAFKYVMVSEPYRYSTPDISNRVWQVCNTL
jgi:hypothetical protein